MLFEIINIKSTLNGNPKKVTKIILLKFVNMKIKTKLIKLKCAKTTNILLVYAIDIKNLGCLFTHLNILHIIVLICFAILYISSFFFDFYNVLSEFCANFVVLSLATSNQIIIIIIHNHNDMCNMYYYLRRRQMW